MKSLYIARQPIFDRNMQLYGYELLYRGSGDSTQASFSDANHATAQVVSLGLIDIGLERLVGKHLAFINLTRDYLLGHPDVPFPQEKVVLEILEDITPDNHIKDALSYLVKRGYSVALDDICPGAPGLDLLSYASIVKVDVLQTPFEALPKLIGEIKKYPVRLVAEKVESGTMVQPLLDMGFDYLQGYFFSRPIIMEHRQLETNQLALLNLLAHVYDPNIEVEELAGLIQKDVSLSYHLLRYINSAFFSLPKKVDSISQVVIYLGRNELRNWVTVLSMAGNTNKPDELVNLAMVRAKMCELIATTTRAESPDTFFTVGLLSILDALMDLAMPDIMAHLPLSQDVQHALLQKRGAIGQALACAQAYETSRGLLQPQHASLPGQALNELYIEAITWANDACEHMKT